MRFTQGNSRYREMFICIETVVRETFKVAFLTYLVFYLLDYLTPGMITNYFNINILLIITAVTGVIALSLFKKSDHNASYVAIWKDYAVIGIGGLTGIALTWYSLKSIGWLGVAISVIVGIVIVLISLNILFSNDEND
ncbi:MAG: hypothetical protein WC289_01935 [Patescibacteria group bacterium]